jgi:hypothetical protein
MVDNCAPHPWARAQNQPLKDEKIKSIFLLSIMCNLFALRETPDSYAKQTRTISVIFPPFADQTETNKNEIKHHNTVFLHTKTWDSHPYASPEEPRTTPSEKCQRWPIVGPLGAAMRLTALRQSSTYISGLKHPKQMQTNSIPNDSYSTLHQALTQGMEMAISFLASLTVVTPDYLNTSPTLLPTPDGAYIISHVRKDNSFQLTNFVISPAHPRNAGHHRHTY